MNITEDKFWNLLSLGQLKKYYQTTLDTNIENIFCVYNKEKSYIKFDCRNDGLYCLDVDNGSGHTNILTTVKDQMENFSDLDMKNAALARYIQKILLVSFLTRISLMNRKQEELSSVDLIVDTSIVQVKYMA